MNGEIFLIRLSTERIVPALCLLHVEEVFSFAQIRKAADEEQNPIQPPLNNEVTSKNVRKEKNIAISNNKKITDTVYIGQPVGLKSSSVVMLKKTHLIKRDAIIKQIAELTAEDFKKCLQIFETAEKVQNLHQQLHKIKKKIQLAQYNNEKYRDLEILKDQILKELGYNNQPLFEKEKKPYLNFREVPNKGRIKVYKGGR